MNRRIVTSVFTVMLIVLFFVMSITAATWPRKEFIQMPESNLNIGGFGNMISGKDIDGDGKIEIYVVNDNWNDKPEELIPRIYKLEKHGENWEMVWKAVPPNIPKQNTWPQLTIADLDKDGKVELIWGIINFTSTEVPNPARVVVYEYLGDGSDNFGVKQADDTYLPNSRWTIADEDNKNIRPMMWYVADPDNDNVSELCFADRAGATAAGGYYFGVASVNNIPDNGDGSETWTLEVAGQDLTLSGNQENKWDISIIGSNLYTYDEAEISKVWWDGSNWNYTDLMPIAAGASVQSAQVVDLDNNAVQEIICAAYDWATDSQKGVYLLEEVGDSLKHTQLINMASFWPSGSRGPWGGAMGDIDGNGKMEFVFGSRASTPNAAIFHVAYKGGDIADPANYELTVIDSFYSSAAATGIWTVINIANVDDDAALEVLYASSTPFGGDLFNPDTTGPIIVLDPVGTGLEDYPVSLANGYVLKQNYPNPFNPTTTISFFTPKAGQVKIAIYDLNGREVRTLVNEYRAGGEYSVTWDGKNSSGQNVSSGTYIYKLKANEASISKMMQLVR